jgi:regulator of chromosome condensation
MYTDIYKGAEGVIGFTEGIDIAVRPVPIPQLKNIKTIECGSNHVIALDHKGNCFSWGCGEQMQLGYRVVMRGRKHALLPKEFGVHKAESIACGSYHSYAILKDGKVKAWGLNAFGETGYPEGAGEAESCIQVKPIDALTELKVVKLSSGEHHGVAITEDGKLYAWGRTDAGQCGIDMTKLPEDDVILDQHGVPRLLKKPTEVPGITDVAFVSAASDTTIAITKDGKAYSFGFSANYQTGQGTEDDIMSATLIDNTAVREKKLTFAGVGGQFGVLACPAEEK